MKRPTALQSLEDDIDTMFFWRFSEFLRIQLLVGVVLACVSVVAAQDHVVTFAPPGDESANFHSEVVRSSLDNPSELLVREGPVSTGPHELFIAESGAGRVLRVSTGQPEKVHEAITGFSVGSLGNATSLRVGPMGMGLLTRTKLVVGTGGEAKGKNMVGVYALPIGGSPITAEKTDHAVGPLGSKVEQDGFVGMAKTEKAFFVVSSGEGRSGWILKADIEANRLASLQPFISLAKTNDAGAPTCIVMIPKPRPAFLVVGQMGSKEVASDSSITFFVPTTGSMAVSLGTGLNDVSALAYSPAGNLYATDISWREEQAGSVYRLDDARIDGKQTCRAVKIASVVRPTALAFTPDGMLYVTALGLSENDKQGQLIKITGKF